MADLENLKPFKFWSITNFPFIADDFDQMTYYEVLCKIVEYLNKQIIPLCNNQNENIRTLSNQVANLQTWFDNLDVTEEVNAKLDEMAESGELEDIIAQYLNLAGIFGFDKVSDMKAGTNYIVGSICRTLGKDNYLDGKGSFYRVRQVTTGDVIDEINIIALTNFPTLIAEKINDLAIENITRYPKISGNLYLKRISRILRKGHQHPEHIPNNVFSYLQGCCYTGNNKAIITSYNTNDDSRVLLQEINIETTEIIREKILDLYHSNSVTYNSKTNELYVATLQININNVKTFLHTIIVIDYVTLEIKRTIEFDLQNNEGTFAISYDVVTDKTILAIQEDSSNLTFYYLNSDDTLTFIDLSNYNNIYNEGAHNNIVLYNNILYILTHNPSTIYMFDLNNNSYIGTYNILPFESRGYVVGEIQALFCMWDTIDKDFIICSGNYFIEYDWFHSYQFFKCNPFKNINTRNARADIRGNRIKVIKVDINSNIINPDGSSERPFKILSEAFEIFNNIDVEKCRIELNEGIYPPCTIVTNKYFELYKSDDSNIDNTIINGLYGSYGLRGTIASLTIGKNVSDTDNQYNINFTRSEDMKITGLKLLGTGIHINIGGNVVIKDIANYEGILFNFLSNTTIKCFDTTPDFNYTGSKPLILTPIKIASLTGINSEGISVDVSKYHDILENNGILYIRTHGNYDYKYIEVPFQTNMSNRIITILHNVINVKTIQLTHNSETDTLFIKILNSVSINGSSGAFTNNTTTASEDLEIYYK